MARLPCVYPLTFVEPNYIPTALHPARQKPEGGGPLQVFRTRLGERRGLFVRNNSEKRPGGVEVWRRFRAADRSSTSGVKQLESGQP